MFSADSGQGEPTDVTDDNILHACTALNARINKQIDSLVQKYQTDPLLGESFDPNSVPSDTRGCRLVKGLTHADTRKHVNKQQCGIVKSTWSNYTGDAWLYSSLSLKSHSLNAWPYTLQLNSLMIVVYPKQANIPREVMVAHSVSSNRWVRSYPRSAIAAVPPKPLEHYFYSAAKPKCTLNT